MSRSISLRAAKSVLAITVVASLAACGDSPSSPTAQRSDADFLALVNAPAAAPVKQPKAALDASVAGAAGANDTTVTTFQVGPAGGVFAIGRHWISFPANSMCDPSLSSYGPSEWNQPCTIAQAPIAVTASAFADSAGLPKVEFAQHLRFDPTKQVIMHMSFDYREGDLAPEILWQREASASAIDEGEIDPAMVTRDGNYWMVYRRVKHFSGYTLSTGFLGLRTGGDIGIDIGLSRGNTAPTFGSLYSGHVVATGALQK